jgi:hypothetical protein
MSVVEFGHFVFTLAILLVAVHGLGYLAERLCGVDVEGVLDTRNLWDCRRGPAGLFPARPLFRRSEFDDFRSPAWVRSNIHLRSLIRSMERLFGERGVRPARPAIH